MTRYNVVVTPDLSLVPGGTDALAHLQLGGGTSERTDAATAREIMDDWTQEVGGIGSFRDRHVGIAFAKRKPLSQKERDALYQQNAFAARVVDLIVDEALMESWEFEHVEGADNLVELRDRVQKAIGLDDALARVAKWSRKDGFALLTIPTDADPKMPIGLQRVTNVYTLAVEPERNVVPLYTDDQVGSETYRKTTYYQVNTLGGDTVEMHRSHCVAFEPIELPIETLQESTTGTTNGKGPSVIDRVYDQLSRYGSSHAFAIAMLYVASLMVIKFEGYAADFRKPSGRTLLQRKAQRMRAQMDALGILMLDKSDEIANVSHTTTGIVDILDRVAQALAAASDMPREILLNESPNGLRGGDLTGAQEIWHKKIRAFQRRVLQPAIEQVLAIVFRSWSLGGADGTCFSIKWRDLWTPTPAAEAETSLKLAQADEIAYNVGGVGADEIRSDRFVRGNRGPLRVDAPKPATPFDLSTSTPELAPADAAETTATPADEAMNGAQIASLISIMTNLNQGLLTYPQAIGALGVAFPSLRGREAAVLGPPPLVAPVAPMPAAPIAPAAPAGPPPSAGPEPGDSISARDAGAKYGVSTRTITRMIERGELSYWGLGAHKRVSASELAEAAKRHEQPAHEPDEPDEPNEPDEPIVSGA